LRGQRVTSSGPNGMEDWTKFIPRGALPLLREHPPSGAPGKRRREVAVLFLDIEGCTRLCEDLPPAEMNEVFELFFSEFLDEIRARSGDVTEVLGDGLLALFEAGDVKESVTSAWQAALAIQARTGELNQRPDRHHDPITVNMGLNAGPALVGFTRLRGRSGERWAYAATGPVTNVAARLCALATQGQTLTTKATADLLSGLCRCRSLGTKLLKNVAGPVHVVEILPGEAGSKSQGTP